MRTVDINDVDRITRSFSGAERRRISKVSGAIDRAIASVDRAFDVFGLRADERPELSTTFLAVLEPARLEAHVADFERLAQVWHSAWRSSTGERARVARRAHEDLAKALSVIRPWLEALDAIVIEQHKLGMPAKRLLPAAERRRMTLLDQPPTRPMTPDQRRDLLDALRRATRPQGGVVNRVVFDRICDLAERGDMQATYQLRRMRELLNRNEQNW